MLIVTTSIIIKQNPHSMQLRIKRIAPHLPIPEFHTPGSVAFDLYSRIETTIKPGALKLIPSNIIVDVPVGYMLMLAARSSTARKFGLMLANGIGTIDQDFNGEDNEIMISVWNFTDADVHISPGDRIAQAILVKIDQPEIIEVTRMSDHNRGSFGSTGKRVRSLKVTQL